MSRRVKLISAAVLLSFVLSSGGGLILYRSAQAWGLVESMLVRGVVQTIALKEAEKRDRSNINKRRDEELKDVNLRVKALEFQEKNKTISAADAARERERYESLRTAIEERAKRERQVVSFQTRNRIRENLKSALPDVIKAATGADPRAVEFLVGILRGEKPLAAALNAAISGGTAPVDPREQFRELEGLLKEVEKAAQGLKGAQGIAIRARVEQALSEASGIAIGDGEIPDDKLTRLRELENQIAAVADKIGDIGRELFPGSEGISRDRFEDNERWQQLNAAVQAQEGPLAGRTIVGSIVRNAIEEATRLAEEAGLNLTPEQLAEVAAGVAEMWVDERIAQKDSNDPKETTPIEDMVRSAVNQTLATAGQDELPTPVTTTAATAATEVPASGGGGAAAPTATSVATATAQPSPTATRVPTVVVPTAAAQPSATTPPPPTATTAPTLTFSGGITEGVAAGLVDSLGSTISLTVNFATGAVSGTISGSGGGSSTFPCSLPSGPTLDNAVVSYTSSYQGTFTGTYDPATEAIGGSMTVGGNVTGSLTQPYTHPECTHLNGGEIPGLGGWSGSGSFSGNVSENGGSISTNWTAGSASASGSTSLSP